MTEQTHPETGVSQEQDPISRMSNLLASQPEGPAETEDAPEPESSAEVEQPESPASDELTPDDLEVEQTPVEQLEVETFEIVHNGAPVKLTREELIANARQGFDYTKKTQAVAEQERIVQARLQKVEEIEQISPHLLNDLAQVRSLEAQLGQYRNIDLVQLATDDPMGYPKVQAQLHLLERAYQQAVNQYQQKDHAIKQHRSQLMADMLRQEESKLPEFVPEWKDESKRTAGKQEVAKYLQNYGMPVENAGRYLDTAFALATVYKAAKYDQLVKAKGEKVKQLRTAPPVTKPGSASSGSAKADRAAEAMQRLRKTGSANDAMAAILNRLK